MELVVADAAGNDLVPLADFEMECEAGWSDGIDNTFDLTVLDASAPLPDAAWRVYADGTDIGGLVRRYTAKSTRAGLEVHWSGDMWTGTLSNRLLWPDAGQDYLTLSGDAHEVLRSVVARLDLGGLFEVPSGRAGVSVSYRCSRDEPDAWTNLRLAMRSAGLRLSATWEAGMCSLSAEPVTDWSSKVDSDLMDFDIERDLLPVTHVKAAGKGELASRQVVDAYADRDGYQSQSKAMAGVFEVESFLDASSSEGEDLAKQAADKLADYQGDGSVSVTVRDETGVYLRLGDIVTARRYAPNVQVRAEISGLTSTVRPSGASTSYSATSVGPAVVGRAGD